MNKNLFALAVSFIIYSTHSFAQSVFPENGIVYNDAIVPRIDIYIQQDSLDELLGFGNINEDHEYPADFIWNDGTIKDTMLHVGFRLRGNTSRSSAKKSFKVKFNHFGSGKFYGYSDLDLNGEHNDPAIIRSKLSWDLMRMAGLEAPRSNHVRLYINNEYRGLYINVEQINADFLKARNKDEDGQLFKCFYGADFKYLGNNPNEYSNNVYEAANKKDNVEIWKFIDFTKALDNVQDADFRCDLEKIFDVDRYLKTMAMEVLMGHWDNLIFNKNNAYLYFNPETDKLEIFTYDTDNTYGIDWFNIDWSQRNIYSWTTSNNRPIYSNLLDVPEYKIRYGYYIKKYLNEFFNPTFLKAYIGHIKDKISPYRVNDYYASLDYGYTYQDFVKSYDEAIGAHVTMGIHEYITKRYASALSQLQNTNISPVMNDHVLNWKKEKIEITFNVSSTSTSIANLHYRYDGGSWEEIAIHDDGIFPDEIAGDRKFAYVLEKENANVLDYFYTIVDALGKTSRWPICESLTTQLKYNATPKLYINEFMADNSLIKDDANEYEDWIEIYNSENYDVFLGDKYISDDALNPDKWKLPDLDLPGHSFITLWADEDKNQGYNHANFKLSKSGEFIGIFDHESNGFAPIDTFTFAQADEDKSYGRYPDGQGEIILLNDITFGISNVTVGTQDPFAFNLQIYPNPSSEFLYLTAKQKFIGLKIYDAQGKMISEWKSIDVESWTIDVSTIEQGVYIINVIFEEGSIARTFIKL